MAQYMHCWVQPDVEEVAIHLESFEQCGKRIAAGIPENLPIVVKNFNTSVIEDAYLVAALVTFDPTLVYYPVLNERGRVAFEVKGEIADKLERLYAGEAAGLDVFIGNLKKLRASIFKLKNAYKKKGSS